MTGRTCTAAGTSESLSLASATPTATSSTYLDRFSFSISAQRGPRVASPSRSPTFFRKGVIFFSEESLDLSWVSSTAPFALFAFKRTSFSSIEDIALVHLSTTLTLCHAQIYKFRTFTFWIL